MKKFKLLLLAFVVFLMQIPIAKSQIPVAGSETLLDKLRLNKATNGDVTTLYADVNGNPYLFKDFKKGQLIVNSGGKFDVFVRYDMYANEMHIKNNGEVYAIIYPEKVKSIEVDSLKFIYSRYVNSSGEEPAKIGCYFIVKADGKCKLLVKKNIRIQDAEQPKLYVDAKPAKFIPSNDTYYLKPKAQNALKIRNEKDLLSSLADQKVALNKFMKSNKLRIKDIDDLIKIVNYYNSL